MCRVEYMPVCTAMDFARALLTARISDPVALNVYFYRYSVIL